MRDTAYTESLSDKYMITCPYCFNELNADDGNAGTPFSHDQVEFRSETYFEDEIEIEKYIGVKKADVYMMSDQYQQKIILDKFAAAEKFMLKTDAKYQHFWDLYDGQTTETKRPDEPAPWLLPIINTSKGGGVERLIRDENGFTISAVDIFGKVTDRRVCPYCHNPLPMGFGRNPVKNISVIGTTHCGKTVYISQLLKGISDYVAKAGLTAYATGRQVSDFIMTNRVEKGVTLPDSTPPKSFSQPMFYDIIQSDANGVPRRDTIVIYDIAGENCSTSNQMAHYGKYVEHADGIMLLVEPDQIGLLSSSQTGIATTTAVMTTLYTDILSKKNKTAAESVPFAVCISKSDKCFDVLPEIAKDPVTPGGFDINGIPTCLFDGRSYNQLQKGLTDLIKANAGTFYGALEKAFTRSNFFACTAIGCECDENNAPIGTPEPRRIEEPILWMFKQFGYIKSNTNVLRPFKLKNADSYIYKKAFLKKPCLIKEKPVYSSYEEDEVVRIPLVKKKNEVAVYDSSFSGIEVYESEGGEV